MSKIFKICLVIAIFIASSSVAWAAFNYDSANNYFLLDSILKTGGDYVLIGDGLSGYCHEPGDISQRLPDLISQGQCQASNKAWREILSKVDADGNVSESTAFFAVSNNLIFLKEGARFESGVRSMSRDEFSTNAITVNSDNNFEIYTIGRAGVLSFFSEVIKMNQDFVIDHGLSLKSDIDPAPYNIYAQKVLTKELHILAGAPGDKLLITQGTLLLTSGGSATADEIYFGDVGNSLCEVIPINAAGAGHFYDNRTTMMPDILIAQTDCDAGDYVYDLSANYAGGHYKMVCCRKDDVL